MHIDKSCKQHLTEWYSFAIGILSQTHIAIEVFHLTKWLKLLGYTNFDISIKWKLNNFPYMPIIFVMQGKCLI